MQRKFFHWVSLLVILILLSAPALHAVTAEEETLSSIESQLYLSLIINQGPPQPPGAFAKLMPANEATNQPIDITLVWETSSGAKSYEYCIDTTDDDSCLSWTSTGSASHVAISGLAKSTTYYWHVRAVNASGTTYAFGSDIAYWSFTTGSGGSDSAEMVLIPAGSFQMGCHPEHNGNMICAPDQLPLRTIHLDAYRIDKYEVTNALYALCVAAGSCIAPAYNSSWTRSSYYDNPDFANYPVLWLSWNDGDAYCTWAGKRLPTEAEWEKAARGESLRAFPWGDELPDCSLANFYDGTTSSDCVGDSTQVGSYPAGASPYGVMDMAGNVWEWVSDWYQENYYSSSPLSNPFGPPTGLEKVIRGGSWSYTGEGLTVSIRYHEEPDPRYSHGGFRCAAPAVP